MEMMQGHFHEPAFYGQAYNTMFEAFLAIPLVMAGMKVYVALPIIAAFLGVFPFILLSVLALKRNKNAALLFLAIPLLLPTEYVLITQLPRGFVAGVFAATIAVSVLVFSRRITAKQLFFSGLAGGISLVLNPNGILLLLPVYLWALFSSHQKIKTVLWLFVGALPGLVLQAAIIWFYVQNPYYISHDYTDTQLSLSNITLAFSHFHELFYGLFPFVMFAGVAIIPTIIFIIYKLYIHGNKNFAIALICTLLFLVFTFTTSKMADGTASVFFPYSRLYLALPILAGIGIYFLFKTENNPFYYKKWIVPGAVIIVFAAIKFGVINERIHWNLRNNSGLVSVFKIEDKKQEYKQLASHADSLGINTLIFYEKKDEYNYGLMALEGGKIRTISLSYERKKWLLQSLEKENINDIIFWCENDSVLNTKGLNTLKIPSQFPLYQVSTGKNPIIFFRETGIMNRKY